MLQIVAVFVFIRGGYWRLGEFAAKPSFDPVTPVLRSDGDFFDEDLLPRGL